jgi:hypothetical protein
VVLMGDSHAQMLTPAIKRVAETEGWSLVTLIKGACPPAIGIEGIGQQRVDGGRSCRRWRELSLGWLRRHPPALIVFTHSHGYGLLDRAGRTISAGARPGEWSRGMRRTLAAMPPESKVLLLGDVPRNRDNPVICLTRHRKDQSECQSPRLSPASRAIEVAIRRVAAAEGARHRTLYSRICTYDPCPLVQGDVLMWRNRGHLTKTFVMRLTPTMRQFLREALAR